MDYNIFEESSVWRTNRDKRINAFVRIAAWFMIVGTISWTPITIRYGLLTILPLNLILVIVGVIILILLRRNKSFAARTITFFTSCIHFLVLCMLVNGPHPTTGEPGLVHFWFIVLAVTSYFFLYDVKPWIRDFVPVVLLLLFFLFQFNYIGLAPVISVDDVDVLNKMTVITSFIVLFFITRQYVVQLTKSEEAEAIAADRLEGLVESMLPKQIAERLRREGRTFADEFHECSVLFADMVGFTSWSEEHTPNEIVDYLNNVFSQFDEIVEGAGLTKIKTIGDSYMVAAGVPEYMHDHAIVLTHLALKLNGIATQDSRMKFRFGINSGSAVAGVIGKKIFIYDLWGDTVNIASRMESSGEGGKVNVSESTYQLIKDEFVCSARGKVEAKHKGFVNMYFVEGEKNAA